jgi:flavodoxin
MSKDNLDENKALIVFSSSAGCTEEVAFKIKETLDNSSIRTETVKIKINLNL